MLQTPLAYRTVGKSNSAGASTQLSATQTHGCWCCSGKKGPTNRLAGCYLGTLCYLDILPKRKCCRGLVPFQTVAQQVLFRHITVNCYIGWPPDVTSKDASHKCYLRMWLWDVT